MSSPWRINYSRYKRFFLNGVSQYRKSRDLKTYLELFLSLLTVIIFAVFALRPTLITIAKLTREIETKEETIGKMDEKIQNLNQARDLYEKESANIRLLDGAIPKNPLPENLVRQIQGVSNESRVGITSMSIGEIFLVDKSSKTGKAGKSEPLSENSGAISFSLNSTNNYTSFVNLLLALENLRRPIKIDSVVFELGKTNEGRVLVLRTSGRTPYFVPGP